MNQNNKQKILPPSSMLAEEIIIGQILSDNTARQYILTNTISSFFTLQKYQTLYHYYATDIEQDDSAALIVCKLWDQKLLKDIGGVPQILKLINRSQAISMYYGKYIYIKHCIKILQRNYSTRLFLQYSYSILQLSHFYRMSIEQVHKKAHRYLDTVHKGTGTSWQIEFRKSISDFLHRVNKSSRQYVKIFSGFRDLDNVTRGFKDGELIVVAGRPSMGKTSFAINIAHHGIFNLKLAAHIFSLEMSKREILDRLVALASHVSIQKIQQKTIESYEWGKIQDACRFLISSDLHINDQEYSSINDIKKQFMNCLSKKKLFLLLTICN